MSPHHVWYCVPGWGHHTAAHAQEVALLEANEDLKVTFVYHVLQSKSDCLIVAEDPLVLTFVTEQRVEADMATYPEALTSRITFMPVGTLLPPSPENNGIMMKQGSQALSEMIPKISPPPTKFILDASEAVEFVDQIKSHWPQSKVYLHWSASATSYYNLCGEVTLRGVYDSRTDYGM